MSGWVDVDEIAGAPGSLADGWIPPSELGEKERVRQLAMRGLFRSPPSIVADRYELRECIGRGGLGTVYRAVDTRLGRDVALKFARALGADEADPRRLFSEALLLARLSHPNIVPVLDVGQLGSEVYIAMELLAGVTVEQWGTTGPSWRDVLSVFRQAGRALEAAHRTGLVHGDVKPANMMVDDERHLRMLDFGLARELSAPSGPAGTTRASGTAGFIAPEVYDGRMDERSDQFSFCVSLFRLLFARHPYDLRPTAPEPDALHRQALERSRGHGVPRWLAGAVLRGLRHDPTDRYASMSALLAALVPPRSRLPWLAGSGVAAVVAVAVIAAQPSERCRLDDEPFAAIWDDPRKQRIGSGATDTSMVDDYTAQWSSFRETSCRDLDRGAISPVLHDLRSRCLQRSRDALAYLLDEIDRPTFTAWDRVPAALVNATDLSVCGDDDALLEGRSSENTDVELADTIMRALDQAFVHLLLGDSATYLARVREIENAHADLDRARDATIWLSAHLGSALNQRWKFADAEAVLRKALLAANAGDRRHDIEGAVLLQLSEAIGSQAGREREALGLAQQAAATLDGSARGRRYRVEALRSLAVAQLRAGRFDQALATIDAAIHEPPNPMARGFEPIQAQLSRASASSVRGLILERLGRNAEAVREYRSGLDNLEPLETDMIVEAHLCTNLGALLRREGQTEEALVLLERGTTIKVAEGLHDNAALTLMTVGNLHQSTGELAKALTAFERALAEQRFEASPAVESDILYNRAIALQSAGRSQAAIADYDRVIEIRSTGPHANERRRFPALVGRGSARLAIGETDAARADFEAALRAEPTDADGYDRAELRLGLARASVGTDRAGALAHAREGRAIAEASGNPDLVVEIDAWLRRVD